ncbi:MAG: hypothetical protein R3323_01920 [Wenzhouxiangellaceae bacterium]|nr:hypothetical protein [Wenzhouxiangellaceae bacterium]
MSAAIAGILLAACGGDVPVALSDEDRAAAGSRLIPAFTDVHAGFVDWPPAASAPTREALDAVAAADPRLAPLSVRLTGEPDADAGCLADGLVFVTQGLLAWVETAGELAAAIAAAATQCPAASADWAGRERVELPPREDGSLELRYGDFRLPGNAALYRQLVRRGCGGEACAQRVEALLQGTEWGRADLDRLAARLAAEWPDSAWLERIGVDPAEGATPATPESGPPLAGLRAFSVRRDGLAHVAESRRLLYRGEIFEAYRANQQARRQIRHDPAAKRQQLELELHNNHPTYAEKLLGELEADGAGIPLEAFWRAWARVQLGDEANGLGMLEPVLERLPGIRAHYAAGTAHAEIGNLDAAEDAFRIVVEAIERPPFTEKAGDWLDVIARRRQR